MKIVALAGGIGAARFLRGLLTQLQQETPADSPAEQAPHQLTIIGNTGDDITLHGLRICPDLDTVMYTLGEGIDESQGWGRHEETHTVAGELAQYRGHADWFTLGDRDIATHLVRTELLAAGRSLTQVTEQLCLRWQLSQRWGSQVRLLPMSDDHLETHVTVAADEIAAGEPAPDVGTAVTRSATRRIHFQQWWVQLRASVPALEIRCVGSETARPAPGVPAAIAAADLVVLPPSNPVVSIGTILGIPGIRQSLIDCHAPVVGVSPIIAGAPVRGMADACLHTIGVPTTARAVAGLYADFLDGWLIDERDTADMPTTDRPVVRSCPLLMRDIPSAAAIAANVLQLGQELRSR